MISYFTTPFRWFFKLEAASGLILLIAAVIALFLSNSNLSTAYFEILSSKLLIGTKEFGLKLSIYLLDSLESVSSIIFGLYLFASIAVPEYARP